MDEALLEYSLDTGGVRHLYGSLSGATAAEAWYLHQYMAEILFWRNEADASDITALPRKEKYFLLQALIRASDAKRVTELGSSLMEIIDGLEAVQRRLWPDESPQHLAYFGVESSAFLAEVSRLLHLDQRPTVVADASETPRAVGPTHGGGVLYDRIISSFAFRDVAGLATFLDRFDCGILNLLTSREETFRAQYLGGEYTYFSLAEMAERLTRPLYHLFGFRAPKHAALRATGRSVVEGFFFYGEANTLAAFCAEAAATPEIAAFWDEKAIMPRLISEL